MGRRKKFTYENRMMALHRLMENVESLLKDEYDTIIAGILANWDHEKIVRQAAEQHIKTVSRVMEFGKKLVRKELIENFDFRNSAETVVTSDRQADRDQIRPEIESMLCEMLASQDLDEAACIKKIEDTIRKYSLDLLDRGHENND